MDLLDVIEPPAAFNWIKREALYLIGEWMDEKHMNMHINYYFSRLLPGETGSLEDTLVFDACAYLSLMGYSDCMCLYPIMIWKVHYYIYSFQIELPQPKTSPIPYVQNDFIPTDITEGKSSILKHVIHNIRPAWFSQYITSDNDGISQSEISVIITILVIIKFYFLHCLVSV